MVELHQKVIAALRERFADVVDALEYVDATGRVTGVVISPSFNGQDYDERQMRLWEVLGQSLTADEQRSVGPIALLTPAEGSVKAM